MFTCCTDDISIVLIILSSLRHSHSELSDTTATISPRFSRNDSRMHRITNSRESVRASLLWACCTNSADIGAIGFNRWHMTHSTCDVEGGLAASASVDDAVSGIKRRRWWRKCRHIHTTCLLNLNTRFVSQPHHAHYHQQEVMHCLSWAAVR